ncbi:XkdX family protein [Pseudobutyrivibrio sp.]
MSKKFNTVKKYYDDGLWSKTKVWNAVGRWITEEEYEMIVGEPYSGGD